MRLRCFEGIEQFLSPGDAKYQEDGMVYCEGNPMTISVSDAYSVPYDDSKHPIIIIDGMSTGEAVTKIFCNTVFNAKPSQSPKEIAIEANALIGDFQKKQRFLFQASDLAGTSFVLAKVTEEFVNIFQGGDCTALWTHKDGSLGFTPNIVAPATRYVNKISAELRQQCDGDLKKARALFTPYLKEEKLFNNNNPDSPQGYPVINGQLNVGMCQEKLIPVNDLRFLLLFSDGLIPFKWFNDQVAMERFAMFVEQNGLHSHMERFGGNFGRGFTKKAEATGIAVWLK